MLPSRAERLKNANSLMDSPSASSSGSFDFAHIKHDSNIRLVSINKLVKAPDEWNFYKPLSDDKMLELIDSILNNGLLQPVVIWQQEGGEYMILAGHNRTEAYRKLLETTNDVKYEKIPALIKNWNELDETTAREIIIDTNWVQRNLSPMEKAKSINQKYNLLLGDRQRLKQGSGLIRDKIAESYNISGRQVAKYKNLNKLISPFQELLNENNLTITIASKLSTFDENVQNYLYEHYNSDLNYEKLKLVSNDSSEEDIDEIFILEEDLVQIKFNIPRYLAKDAEEMMKNWLESNHKN
jgi:ParB family chromosome partitioning protein